MRLFGLISAILYAALMLFALLRAKQKAFLIAAGCALILAYALIRLFGKNNFTALLIAGMIAISLGTLLNGIRQGSVHPHHHLIRLVIEAAITALCLFGA